jgi:DNA-binding protein HU-beta
MNSKTDLVKSVSESLNMTQKDVKLIIDEVFSQISETLLKGEPVAIRGFGKFEVSIRKPRIARDIRRSMEIKIPSRRTVKFRISKELKMILESLEV